MQATIGREVSALGTGLHSGERIYMTLKPAPPETGISFVRQDLDNTRIRVSHDNIDYGSLQLATTIAENGAFVQTTEHLLSACYGFGIDNLIVELNGAEVPIMDGSAVPFLVLLEEAGIEPQFAPHKILEITAPIAYEHQGKHVVAEPASDFRVTYEIDFDHPKIRKQAKTVIIDRAFYRDHIAPARTFGFLHDVEMLQDLGLIKGGSLDNAVVLDGDDILNGRLRFTDELISHKILDLIGDFAVTGYRFRGHIRAHKAGHEMHARFLEKLLASDAYRLVRETDQGAFAESTAEQAFAIV